MKAAAENYVIKTVSRALDLLDQFREDDSEFGITDLSKRMELQKNNVFRLIVTLKAKKYIEINSATGKYRLGIKARALGQLATQQIDFASHVRPILNDLKQQSHETCYFSVVKEGYAYYLDGVESDLPVRVVQMVGNSRPLNGTAAGKVLLAFMEPQNRMELISGKETEGITDVNMLNKELYKVAQQGYAIDDQEYDAGVMEIAAPVFDANGGIIGALSILGPEMRLAGTRLENELLPLVCQSASRLSVVLGYCRTEEALSEISRQTPKSMKITKMLETRPYFFGGLQTCC
jgi:IclR family KDG regulon transcriptional repressor